MTEETIERTKADLESKGLWFEVTTSKSIDKLTGTLTEVLEVICRQCRRPGRVIQKTTPEVRAAGLYRPPPDLCFECIAENDDEADGLIDGTIY